MGLYTSGVGRTGARDEAGEHARARVGALRIYTLADNPKITAKAFLASVDAEPRRAMKMLLLDVHPGRMTNLSPDDTKLLGLAANVVTTAFDAVHKPSAAADSAFANACGFARSESAWAKQYVADNKPVATQVAVVPGRPVFSPGDIYEPSMVMPTRPQTMPVLVSDPKVQAMHAGIRAALDAYAEIMALGEPERPRISIYV